MELQSVVDKSDQPFDEGLNNMKNSANMCHSQDQKIGRSIRKLTEDEIAKLERDDTIVSEFKQKKLEEDAKKNWDLFYKRNTTKFFKDRHWTKREFEDLTRSSTEMSKKNTVMFEVGCGVGNFMFPLLEEDPTLIFYACDFSPRAVEFVKSHSQYDANRCTAFQCDITVDPVSQNVPGGSVDLATLIFVLSAVHPEKMVQAIQNIAQALKAGGILLFRDYGLHDYAMLRFSKGHKLSENFYVRQDGTRAYYFSLEKLESIMESAGLEVLQTSYVHRSTVNKKEGVDVPRVFVQGRFQKPKLSDSGNKTEACAVANDDNDVKKLDSCLEQLCVTEDSSHHGEEGESQQGASCS